MSLASYDIELNSDVCDPYNNAELTITLRLGFRQVNPAGGAAEGTYHDYGDATAPTRKIVKWTKGAWELWKSDFVKSAQNYWNGKFWLVNNFNVMEFKYKDTVYRPNVWCRFSLIGSDHDKGVNNFVIDVVRLHRTENWFGSHSRLYDNRDTNSVQKGTDGGGSAIMQRAHVHEVGHLLGLGHVDEGKPHCPAGGDTNASACYGVADVDKNSVMGQGMTLTALHAAPWRKSIRQLTGKGNVIGLTDWAPVQRRHYPRTAAEVLARRAITLRLRR
ncbi:MAG: hypothetical protein MUP90_16080 [Gammaproteobacteria bacterium]|nr:hypothetical protein [Gammaproteobacteria bacterium]